MNTRTQSFVLLLFGAALLRLTSGNALLRYVRPSARPWIVIAGGAFVLLALWSLVADRHSIPDRGSADLLNKWDSHGHNGVSRAAWLVVAPVVVILLVAPPALGAFSVSHSAAAIAQPSDASFPSLQGDAPVPLKVFDLFARGVWDKGRTLAGHRLSITGFVVHQNPDGFELARLVITCCAADAMPVSVEIVSTGVAPPIDGWVTVTGTYAGVRTPNANLPLLQAEKVTSVATPSNPYDG